MELVQFDADLLLNERQVASTRKSISRLKKRLHDTQLTLILQPTESDPVEMHVWNIKVNELINRKEKLDFPSMRNILQEKEVVAITAKSIAKPTSETTCVLSNDQHRFRQSSVVQEQMWEKMKRIELRKRLGTDQAFGANAAGEVLRTIENYQGHNGMNTTSRILVRKHHRPGPFDNVSSVPISIGPGQYEKSEPPLSKPGGDIGYQIAFKACPREKTVTASGLRQTAIRRNLANRHEDPDSNYYLRQTDKNFYQNIMESITRTSSECAKPYLSESTEGINLFSAFDSINDQERYGSQSLDRLTKLEDHYESDKLNKSVQLSTVAGRLKKVKHPEHSEIKDYTLGALLSLRHQFRSDLGTEKAFEPERRYGENILDSDVYQAPRCGTGRLNRSCSSAASTIRDRDSGFRSGSIPLNLHLKTSLPLQSESIQCETTEPDRQSLWQDKEPYTFLKNNDCQALLSHNKMKPKSSTSRGPLFVRENTKTVKRIYFPLKKKISSDISGTSSLSPSSRFKKKVDEAPTSYDFETKLGSTESSAHLEFPSLDTDSRPHIDKWYIDTDLNSPSKEKKAMKIKNNEYESLHTIDSLGLSNTIGASKENLKNVAHLSKSDYYIKNNDLSMDFFSLSSNDMDHILLPQDVTVDAAVTSQLFSSTADFHHFLHQNIL